MDFVKFISYTNNHFIARVKNKYSFVNSTKVALVQLIRLTLLKKHNKLRLFNKKLSIILLIDFVKIAKCCFLTSAEF